MIYQTSVNSIVIYTMWFALYKSVVMVFRCEKYGPTFLSQMFYCLRIIICFRMRIKIKRIGNASWDVVINRPSEGWAHIRGSGVTSSESTASLMI